MSEHKAADGAVAPATQTPRHDEPTGPQNPDVSRHSRFVLRPAVIGVLGAYAAVVIVFLAMRPDVFTQWITWQSILDQSALPAIIAVGLTIALINRDFDLSIGAVVGMAMGISVELMAHHGVSWGLAVVAALVASALVGVVNGLLVTRAGVNSFIGTLAISSVVGGLDARITNQETISSGLPQPFVDLGTFERLGFGFAFWVAVVLAVALYVLVVHTEVGRYFYVVGANPEGARLAGLRVRTLRTWGFVVAATTAGLAGILLATQSASYYPNAGPGYLLPAYAAAFLGTALAAGRFGIFATAFGVLFLQTLQTGLTVINVESWVVMVVQGLVLVMAVWVSSATGVLRNPFRKRTSAP